MRRHAVRLLTAALDPVKTATDANEWKRALIKMSNLVQKADHGLKMQLAYSLGDSTVSTLARILLKDAGNRELVSAVFSSLNETNIESVLRAVTFPTKGREPSLSLTTKLTGLAVEYGKLDVVAQEVVRRFHVVKKGVPAGFLEPVAEILIELRKNKNAWDRIQETNAWKGRVQSRMDEARLRCLVIVDDPMRGDDEYVDAIRFLSACGAIEGKFVEWLSQSLHPQRPPTAQLAVIDALAQSNDPRVPTMLLSRWAILTPAIRGQIVDTLLGRNDWTLQILEAVEAGELATNQLDAAQRERLVTHRDAGIRERAAKLFDVEASSDRQALIEDFEPLLKLAGDESRGRVIFEKRCSSCHRLRGIGKSIGADLAALKDRTGKALLTAMLDPNRAVEAKFLSYTAVTDAGKTVSGMLLSETGNSVTLVSTDGKEHVLLRKDLDQLINSQRSLMPEGLEKDLSQQDIADVIAFVQTSGLKPKELPFNVPAEVVPADDGVIRLPASVASVFGPNLIVEEHFRNLGNWFDEKDHAAWTIVLPDSNAQRSFDVEFDFACHRSSAGNQLVLSVAGQTLEGRVPSTNRWDRYSTWNLGTITFPPGTSRLVVFTRSPPIQALIDVREIRLIPRDE